MTTGIDGKHALSLGWLCLLVLSASACKVTPQDVQRWKGTVKGPGKLVAVMRSDKYDMSLRTQAALALVEMERQDVDGVAELQHGIKQLPKKRRTDLLNSMTPGLIKLMLEDSDDDASEDTASLNRGSRATPLQTRAKDAAFLMIPFSQDETKKKLTDAVIAWFVEDFNERSLSGNFSAEQVVQNLGHPAAAQLVKSLDVHMHYLALLKVAQLIANVGDVATKAEGGRRLVEIELSMEAPDYRKWIEKQLREQLKRQPETKVSDKKLMSVAAKKQQEFINNGALPAMKHLASQPVVAQRLLAIASAKSKSKVMIERRKLALQALEGNAKPEHLSALLALALNEEEPDVLRDYAFDRVGDTQDSSALPKLWPLVENADNERSRWRAGELVLSLGGTSAVETFFEKLPATAENFSPAELQSYATRLAQINPSPKIQVAKQLGSADWCDKIIALRYFERKGNAGDQAAIRPLMTDAQALAGKGWPKDQTVGKVANEVMTALTKKKDSGA